MQLYELEKRLTMDVKALAKMHGIDMSRLYVNVQTSKNAYGHFSPNRWVLGEKKERVDELALNPEFFESPLEVLDTMLHELTHVYCNQNNIKDTSRGGHYHNKRFKDVAEKFGLLCVPTENGWNTTAKGNEEKLEALNSTLPYPITCDMVRRSDRRKKVGITVERVKPHVYTCSCGIELKHKDHIYVACYNCKSLFTMDEDDSDFNNWVKEGGMFVQMSENANNAG